jgi:hypothetical protein
VRELFGELFAKLGDDIANTIDAGRSVEEVANDVAQLVFRCIESVESKGPLKKLGPLNA